MLSPSLVDRPCFGEGTDFLRPFRGGHRLATPLHRSHSGERAGCIRPVWWLGHRESEPSDPAQLVAAPPRIDLAAPLAAEVALARAGAPVAAADGAYVMNSVTGVAHRVLFGFDDSPPTNWLAACGWKFGLSIWRAVPVQLSLGELPKVPQLLRARCLPDMRQSASLALAHLHG